MPALKQLKLAPARMGLKVAMVTLSKETIGQMSSQSGHQRLGWAKG